jgi:hypothetical protein
LAFGLQSELRLTRLVWSGRVGWSGRSRRAAVCALARGVALSGALCAFLRPTDACGARRLPLPVCAACRPVACRGDAVAVMGALLSMSLARCDGRCCRSQSIIEGVLSRPRKRTTNQRIRHHAGFQASPDAGPSTLRWKRCSPVAKRPSRHRF